MVEKELTLAVTLAAADSLRARGTTVVLTRSSDALGSVLDGDDVQNGALTTAASEEDLEARVRCANLARADALVSVHFNSFDDPTVGGTETLYEPDRPLAPRSRNPADLGAVASSTGTDALGEAISAGITEYLDGSRRR